LVRITGGAAKGRRVGLRRSFSVENKDEGLRPTAAKVREALFNILQKEINGSEFLDLYAGTGAVGIEALSRGAGRVEFVEKSDARVKTLRSLLSQFGFEDRGRVIRAEAISFVRKTAAGKTRYDIIFLDPPYASGELGDILPLIGECGIVKEGGAVMAEHLSKNKLPRDIRGLRFAKDYIYGDTALSRYIREES